MHTESPAPGELPLVNPRHEQFALRLAAAEVSATESYRQEVSTQGTQHSVHVKASRLALSTEVQQRIQWLRDEASKEAEKRADLVVLSIAEKRDFLARLVRAQVGELEHDSDLWCAVETSEQGTKYKLPDKLKAIQIDNDLAVEGAEAKGNEALTTALNRIRAVTHV